MFDIYLREAGHSHGIEPSEFENEFGAICRSHLEADRALAFAFILFDYDHPEVRKVLYDQVYWDALNNLSGKYLTVFSLNLKAEEDLRAKRRQSGEHPGNSPLLDRVRVLLEGIFQLEIPRACPLILFFNVEEGRFSAPCIYRLNAASIESAFHEIRDALAAAVQTVEGVQPQFRKNTRDIFKLIKQALAKRKSFRLAKTTAYAAARVPNLFSVIVAYRATAWETDQLMRMEAARFKEFSDGRAAKAIHLSKPETLSLLNGRPALLMYESSSEAKNKDTVRYGLVREVALAGSEITFQFEEEGRFPLKIVSEFGDRLGINSFEYSRTHWAIKDGALPSAMLANLQRSYDIVLSFAGEDREYVDSVAKNLRSQGVKVFYDTFEQAGLWGKDLAEHLDSVYQRAGKYCIVFISKHYAKKMWTRHERRAALARALTGQNEYILPARFDDTELDGLPHTTGYVSLAGKGPKKFVKLVLEKLGRQPSTS